MATKRIKSNKIMVSVIMPCYNAGKYIREAIESVVNQTYQDWELIIINDGSTDNSQQVVEDYIKSSICNLQSRISLINQPNSGACRARNNGIEHAKGEYIKFLDADDMLNPNCLVEQIEQISQLNENQIPIGYYGNIDAEGQLLSTFMFSSSEIIQLTNDAIGFFFSNWHVLISSPLHRKSLLTKVGGFDESLKCGQEFDLHFRMALLGVDFKYYPTYTFVYRDYESEHRISCNSREQSQQRIVADNNRVERFERLLLKHYEQMPLQYHPYFVNHFFARARKCFSNKQIEDGKLYLQRMSTYKIQSYLPRMYLLLGKIMGYYLLECILQLRLYILSKK